MMKEFILYGHPNQVVRVINGEVFTEAAANRKIGRFRDGAVYGLDGRFMRRLSRPETLTADESARLASEGLLAAD